MCKQLYVYFCIMSFCIIVLQYCMFFWEMFQPLNNMLLIRSVGFMLLSVCCLVATVGFWKDFTNMIGGFLCYYDRILYVTEFVLWFISVFYTLYIVSALYWLTVYLKLCLCEVIFLICIWNSDKNEYKSTHTNKNKVIITQNIYSAKQFKILQNKLHTKSNYNNRKKNPTSTNIYEKPATVNSSNCMNNSLPAENHHGAREVSVLLNCPNMSLFQKLK